MKVFRSFDVLQTGTNFNILELNRRKLKRKLDRLLQFSEFNFSASNHQFETISKTYVFKVEFSSFSNKSLLYTADKLSLGESVVEIDQFVSFYTIFLYFKT